MADGKRTEATLAVFSANGFQDGVPGLNIGRLQFLERLLPDVRNNLIGK